jgi:hypothetical protein
MLQTTFGNVMAIICCYYPYLVILLFSFLSWCLQVISVSLGRLIAIVGISLGSDSVPSSQTIASRRLLELQEVYSYLPEPYSKEMDSHQ